MGWWPSHTIILLVGRITYGGRIDTVLLIMTQWSWHNFWLGEEYETVTSSLVVRPNDSPTGEMVVVRDYGLGIRCCWVRVGVEITEQPSSHSIGDRVIF